MIPMRSRRRLMLCATLLAGVAAAQATAATTVSLDGPDSRFGSPGTVYVTGGGARSHAIDVVYRSDTDSFVITDSRRFGTLDSGCERLKRRRLRCQSPAPKGPADVTIIGGKRDDRLRVNATVKGFSRLDGQNGDNLLQIAARAKGGGELDGGDGRDRIFGGGGDDTISDFGGADVVRGRGGDDFVFVDLRSEDRGHNRIFTGSGGDLVLAKNGHRDELIDCGPGKRDEAGLDRIDPKPRSCERVRRY